MNRWRSIAKTLMAIGLVFSLVVNPLWSQPVAAAGLSGLFSNWKRSTPKAPLTQDTQKITGKISEAAPPPVIQELRQVLEQYQPQVAIVSPRPNETLTTSTVSVRFQVRDLPVFQDEALGLGPHLHVLLDNQTYQAVYDLNQPLVLENLQPGTHTIRAIASRPWHESFKNEGAFAQTTFHVFTKTQENSPDRDLPLLTYSRPQGSYGAEPILLDFYLTNAPLHLVAQENARDEIADWRIRATVNGESFLLDRWQAAYLKGFKPGTNWVQLEYLDEKGKPVTNLFNNTARVITYAPGGTDTLSRLMRNELPLVEARAIVDPNYLPPAPEPEPSPEPSPEPESSPAPSPEPSPTPSLEAEPAPAPSPEPSFVPIVPPPIVEEIPAPPAAPEPAEPSQVGQPEVPPEVQLAPVPAELAAPAAPQPVEEAIEPELTPGTALPELPRVQSPPDSEATEFSESLRQQPAAAAETAEKPQRKPELPPVLPPPPLDPAGDSQPLLPGEPSPPSSPIALPKAPTAPDTIVPPVLPSLPDPNSATTAPAAEPPLDMPASEPSEPLVSPAPDRSHLPDPQAPTPRPKPKFRLPTQNDFQKIFDHFREAMPPLPQRSSPAAPLPSPSLAPPLPEPLPEEPLPEMPAPIATPDPVTSL